MSKRAANKSATYRPAVVTFIDILGFRNIVEKRSPQEIKKIISAVQRHAGSDDYKSNDKEVNFTRSIFFSDSVVRVRPFDAEYNEGSLFFELIDLVHAQAELANLKVFIRGGLTVGNIFIEGQTLFGPAMVRAYELESSYANYPRIVIDPLAVSAFLSDPRLRKQDHTIEEERGYIKSLVKRGADGLYYLNYLEAFRGEMDDPEEYPEFLRRLKTTILEEVKNGGDRLNILQKYTWLARYQNTVASKFEDCQDDKSIVFAETDIPLLKSF